MPTVTAGSQDAEDDGGHVVVFERATEFTDTVLDFLDAACPRAAPVRRQGETDEHHTAH